MPYVAIQDITLNDYDVKPGEVIPEEKMRGYYPSTLTRLGFAKFVPEAQPVELAPKTENHRPEEKTVYVEEIASPDAEVTETESNVPVKAELVKAGVWHQVFVNGKKIFNDRDEKKVKKFLAEYNAKIAAN